MSRKSMLLIICIIMAVLLAGCAGWANVATEDYYKSWVKHSYFQKRFDKLPDGMTCSAWQNEQQSDGNTIHSAVLSCNGDSYQYNLEITVNDSGHILNILLQNEQKDISRSSFSAISYHVFCSMGFGDVDGKGNQLFSKDGSFDDYFLFFSEGEVQKSMWVNSHEINYTQLPESNTYCFSIRY